MRAVRNTEAGIRVVDVPAPDHAGHAGARARRRESADPISRWCGPGSRPGTLGHEIAGVLDDGTEVAVHPFVPCGACAQCVAGRLQLCRETTASMLGVFVDGGMAEEVVVPTSCVVPLPAGHRRRPTRRSSNRSAVALHVCNRAGVDAGMRVGVIGAGTIGLLSGAVARHLGADVDDRRAPRRATTRRGGTRLSRSSPPRDCDIVFEAAGTASGFDDAVRACRRAGTIGLVSTTWEPISISFLNAQMREVTIVPAFVYGEAHGHREFDDRRRVSRRTPRDHPRRSSPIASVSTKRRTRSRSRPTAAHGAIKVVLHP